MRIQKRDPEKGIRGTGTSPVVTLDIPNHFQLPSQDGKGWRIAPSVVHPGLSAARGPQANLPVSAVAGN